MPATKAKRNSVRIWARGAAPRTTVKKAAVYLFTFARNRVGPLQQALAAATHAWMRSASTLRTCLTCRTLLPTTLADTDATCSRCLERCAARERGELRPFLRSLYWRSLFCRPYACNVRASCGTSAMRTLCRCARYSFKASGCRRERIMSLPSTCTSIIVQLSRCGAALIATLLDAYSGLEVLCWCAGLVFESIGMQPNSHENRSDL